ncbi:MAG: hypothetical protein HOF15_17225 [Planctomycetaceae bacterium]|nr:hypothetical protein [Planctomycetaceae bacterium]MBT5124340.1 hypothetical protein [Planctomycetaceae bacterium]
MISSTDYLLGITVLPEYFQVEGAAQVIANCVETAHANAITTSPYVMCEAVQTSPQLAQREPPIDAGAGGVRLLDRPLWGKRELYVQTAPAFSPSKTLYRDLKYQPPSQTELTREQQHHIHEALKLADENGVLTYMQVQAAIPPGYRVQFAATDPHDLPLLPNQQPPQNRVAANASLASADILDYHCALVVDLCNQYPSLTGIRVDWPEYPPYRLDSVFLDFSPAVDDFSAHRKGTSFSSIRQSIGAFYEAFHGNPHTILTDSLLQDVIASGAPWKMLAERFSQYMISDWLQLKNDLVFHYIQKLRAALDSHGHQDKQLVPHAFPPPFNVMSGLDFSRIAPLTDHIPVKLYTMHWAMIARFYLDQIHKNNPQLTESLLVAAIFKLLQISDEAAPARISDVKYPSPSESHLPSEQVQCEKIAEAQSAAGETRIAALVHGYGPVEDTVSRLRVGLRATDNHIWVNRYGYLNDEKLVKLGALVLDQLQ